MGYRQVRFYLFLVVVVRSVSHPLILVRKPNSSQIPALHQKRKKRDKNTEAAAVKHTLFLFHSQVSLSIPIMQSAASRQRQITDLGAEERKRESEKKSAKNKTAHAE